MKRLFFFMVTFVVFHVTMAQQPDFYYLQVYSENSDVNCYINGFPVYLIKSESPASNIIRVEMYLVKNDNELSVSVKPINDSSPKVTAKIVAYQKGDIVTFNDGKSGVVDFELSGNDTNTMTLSFENEKFDFSRIFKDNPALEEEEVIAYGKKLYSLIKKKKLQELLSEMEVKISDYATIENLPIHEINKTIELYIKSNFFNDPHPSVDKVNISAQSSCGGKIWEIYLNDKPLFWHDDKNSSSSIKVYVAKIDGKMCVVR